MIIQDVSAIVSGGVSGLGEATTRRLVAGGARVVMMDLNEEKGKAMEDELGESVKFMKTNVASPDDVSAAIAAAEAMAPLRIAVNCAGIGSIGRTINRDGTAHDLDVFKKTIEVNLIGTFNVIRLAAAAMSKNDPLEANERGVIINTASVAAYEGQIGQAAYSASKGGVVGMTLPIARDLAVAGIRVLTIAPGTFDTPMLGMLPEEIRQAIANGIPFPKLLGDPAQYAHLVEHMVQNSYMNGETVRIDGALRLAPK
ncbi:MAG: SDR family NAD(P)-dependent oxidoreductase [Deltaproteobacteria bacterium]|jgi:NAD(P)-dependent dehydrogenase (short-subunit alcohol dehydrogenase family)|nr:SDR family NAD(P)-dependent oxidoreductase [Deltaproteobacteria bacterium]MBT6433297.1 SDR family NAD(P)-dependent oxidoreductase [Deltaproteobacteria bacterium]MBT6489550.1 SDR family NAD(P)-dependent oxidoreductase [Deltaproteobacteria bacterium]